MIHVYYGDGKGKTSAALGLALRACGAGKSAVFYSFLKDNNSSERLAKCDIQFYQNPDKLPFLFSMTQQERMLMPSGQSKRLKALFRVIKML